MLPLNFLVGSLTIANMLYQMKSKLGNSTCWDPRNEAYNRGEWNSEDDREEIPQDGSCAEKVFVSSQIGTGGQRAP